MIRQIMNKYRFIDIGVNLTDPVFQGFYHGKQAHENDFKQVLERADKHGVEKMIVTVGRLEEFESALNLCKDNKNIYCTVGCHPTRSNEFEQYKAGGSEGYFNNLLRHAGENTDQVVAIGEIGLDYDREHFCKRDTQKKYFEKQLELAKETKLPMFLHMRNANDDFIEIYKRHRDDVIGGVAHCFTGSVKEAKELIDLGLSIGITGCSLKTADNLETLKSIPIEYLMVETDAPWCDIRNTHAGVKHVTTKFESKKKEKWERGLCVKSRNEPCHIVNVLEIMAAVRGEDIQQLADTMYENTQKMFFKNK